MSTIQFPEHDYVSPGLERIKPDEFFPNMYIEDIANCTWSYARRNYHHNFYCDTRLPGCGFVNRDEAHILYNTALLFKGKAALEIGCFFGWSACHLALGGVMLDVIDPGLGDPVVSKSVIDSLRGAGVLDRVKLRVGKSPHAVTVLGDSTRRTWDLIFIDGNHNFPAPVNDAVICEEYASPDCMILFHDLYSPNVTEGLRYLHDRGWKTKIYYTSQVMGVAWRGNVHPIEHTPDPTANWDIPQHLKDFPI